MKPIDFERVVRAAVRRPALVAGVLALLAAAGGIAALGLRPSAATDTLVDGGSDTFKATERYHERFGDDAVYVLVKGDLTRQTLTADLGRLVGLEGCLSGNLPRGVTPPGGARGPCARLARSKPAQVVYGPGTFINEAVRQIQEQFTAQQSATRAREARARRAAAELAKARGLGAAEQKRLGDQAAQLVQAEFVRDTLRLALNYGITSIPQINDPRFVSQLVFDPTLTPDPKQCPGTNQAPKARFAYLFPSACSSLVQVRLRPDLGDAGRTRAIALIRAATRMPEFRLKQTRGAGYVVTGAPVVVSDLTDEISSSIVVLLVAALFVMALTLAVVFRSVPRLLPLALALAAAGIVFGAMRLVGATLTMASIAVLPVLVGLGVDYAIQFQSRFDEAMAGGASAPDAAQRAAAVGAPTIATASLATATGFLVLLLSPVPMVRAFGLLLVIGIAVAFVCALTAGFAVLAAVRSPAARRYPGAAAWRGAAELCSEAGRLVLRAAGAVVPVRTRRTLTGGARRAWGRALREATTRPARMLGIAAAIAVLGLAVDTQTKVVSDLQRLVPSDLGAVRDLSDLQSSTGVAGEIDVTVESDDLTDPRVIAWMSRYQKRLLTKYGYTSKRGCGQALLCPALSLPDLFRTSASTTDRARIRTLLDAVPPYFSQAVITGDRRLATLAFGIKLVPLERQQEVIDEMRQSLDPPEGVTAKLVGLPVLASEANSAVSSPWRRLLTVLAGLLLVAGVLLAVYRQAERALVPLVPIALATGWSALVLFALRVPLNPMSVTLGVLVIAISTEFSILLSERYRQERVAGHAPDEALARTYSSTGAAVLASGITAIAGFAVLILSPIRMLRDFGFVTVIDLSVSLLGVLVVLPAVLVLAERGELLTLPAQGLSRLRRALGWRPRRAARAGGPAG